jgi:hypothetical protein
LNRTPRATPICALFIGFDSLGLFLDICFSLRIGAIVEQEVVSITQMPERKLFGLMFRRCDATCRLVGVTREEGDERIEVAIIDSLFATEQMLWRKLWVCACSIANELKNNNLDRHRKSLNL